MTFPTRFQHPPSSWKVIAHPHMSCKLLKFWAWEQFGEAISKVVMSGDICIMDVSSFDPFMDVVMLNVNMLCLSMERLVTSQDIGPNVVTVNTG